MNFPNIWSTAGCNAKAWHLLGESLDPACAAPAGASQLALYHAPQEQNITQKSKYYL